MSNVTISAPAPVQNPPDLFTAIAGANGILPGMAVSWSTNIAGEVVPCSGHGTTNSPNCCGLVQSLFVNAIGLTIVTIRRAGVLSLALAQWAAAIVGAPSAGLNPGQPCYVSGILADAGMLNNPNGFASVGDSVIPVGIAIDTTDLEVIIQTPVTVSA